MTPGSENVDTLRRWSDTYQRAGFEGAAGLVEEIFDPEVEFSPLLAREVERRTYRGHDGVRAFFEELGDTLGDLRYSASEFEVVDDNVILLLTTLSGTGRGSAVPVGQDLALVYEFRDGLVVRFTAYGSRDEAFQAAQEVLRA